MFLWGVLDDSVVSCEAIAPPRLDPAPGQDRAGPPARGCSPPKPRLGSVQSVDLRTIIAHRKVPVWFTREKRAKFLSLIAVGYAITAASREIGISRVTVLNWSDRCET